MGRLEELNLSGTRVTDDGLATGKLNFLRLLCKLNLSRTNVSDSGVANLQLPELTLLNLDWTLTTEQCRNLLGGKSSGFSLTYSIRNCLNDFLFRFTSSFRAYKHCFCLPEAPANFKDNVSCISLFKAMLHKDGLCWRTVGSNKNTREMQTWTWIQLPEKYSVMWFTLFVYNLFWPNPSDWFICCHVIASRPPPLTSRQKAFAHVDVLLVFSGSWIHIICMHFCHVIHKATLAATCNAVSGIEPCCLSHWLPRLLCRHFPSIYFIFHPLGVC